MSGEVCGDNRFELIEKYKRKLIEATNIEASQDEMAVLDEILFRFWQVGWLKKLEYPILDLDKYEYHYDHTDCIWYRPEARNRCPATCAQYRDGWNDAMQYIFRDGAGYRPYRRNEKYERRADPE